MKLNILYDIYNILSDEMKKKVLDITGFKCPLGFLKTKQFIKENKENKKIILVKGKKEFQTLFNSLNRNFELTVIEKNNDIYEIQLK